MENKKEKTQSAILRCLAFGDLRPAEIRPECEECEHNAEFADKGGCPGMLLTGSRENLAAAMRAPGGVAFEDVVVVNAKRFQAMEDALKIMRGTLERFTDEEERIVHSPIRSYYSGKLTIPEVVEISKKALDLSMAKWLEDQEVGK